MRRIALFFLLSSGLLLARLGNAQSYNCGTHFGEAEMHHLKTVLKKRKVSQQKDGEVKCIPVRFHIVRSDDGFTQADDASILQALTVMNNQYFDVGFSFFLIEPPIYLDDSDYLALTAGVTEADIRAQFDSPQNALNFYVIDELNPGVAGYAYYPSPSVVSNAVFLKAEYVASPVGAVVAHELGHYFGLPHTFQGTENGNGDPGAENVARTGGDANCETAGDSFCDTNADPGDNNLTTNCIYTGSEMDITGVVYDPPISNPMSYFSWECKTYMSDEQYATVIQGYDLRQSYTEYNLDGEGASVNPPSNLDYSVDNAGNITLTFQDNADNEFGYLIEMSNSGVDDFRVLFEGFLQEDETSFTYPGFDPNETYWFRVRAAAGNCSTNSNIVFIPAGFNLDADGSSGAENPDFNAGVLCGKGSLSLTDDDFLLLGSANGVEINVQLGGVLDGVDEYLTANEISGLEISGLGTSTITALNSGNLPLHTISDWIGSIEYVHDGDELSRGTRTATFRISSSGADGNEAIASFLVDRTYDAGPGGTLTACPEGSPAWDSLLPENADDGSWFDSSNQPLSGSFNFEDLTGLYTFTAGLSGCEVEAEYSIVEVSPPGYDISIAHPECETQCNGEVSVEYSNDFIPFLDGVPFENKVDGLCASSPLITITNGTGCSRTETPELNYRRNVRVEVPAVICTGDMIELADVIELPAQTTGMLNGSSIRLYSAIFIAPADTNLLELYNYHGCIDRSFIFESLNCPTSENTHFFIPGAFTPDGDGLNDLFKPVCAFDLQAYEFIVFDRHGRLLFETNDILIGWNGAGSTDMDYYVPTTQFTYRIKYKLIGDLEFREIKGSAMVIR
jgi:gliding motility-associated-like protein